MIKLINFVWICIDKTGIIFLEELALDEPFWWAGNITYDLHHQLVSGC